MRTAIAALLSVWQSFKRMRALRDLEAEHEYHREALYYHAACAARMHFRVQAARREVALRDGGRYEPSPQQLDRAR